ncbi:polyprenyl synthetase family protein [bacterium]|nr:polyprenyl synthetase family protein [bacterium]
MTTLNEYKEIIDKKLDEFLKVEYPEEIFNSMRYSVLADGKRLRPVMVLEACKMFSGDFQNAIPTACALEMLHAQSLIHDDLPCMDNDDFRRGKPTNHKAFSESTAVLAGDALLSFAPQIIIKNPCNNTAENILKVLDEFFTSAGAYGIIAGQIVDIDSEHKEIDFETLKYIHKYKTAHLFKCALKCGAILGGANDEQLKNVEQFADEFGLAFQICDDILDVVATFEEIGKTPNKDAKAEKMTYVTCFGLEDATKKLQQHIKNACDILNNSDFKSEILFNITLGLEEKILKRINK